MVEFEEGEELYKIMGLRPEPFKNAKFNEPPSPGNINIPDCEWQDRKSKKVQGRRTRGCQRL